MDVERESAVIEYLPLLWEGRVGDYVTMTDDAGPKFAGRTYIVTQLLPRNVKVQDVETGALVRTDRYLIVAATDADAEKARNVQRVETFVVGQTVKLKAPTREDRTLVVIKADPLGGKYSLAVLGGDGGRYFRSVPARSLVAAPVPA